MKAKLKKFRDNYDLFIINENNQIETWESTDNTLESKLSKQNCDEIFGVIDVEKLAEEEYKSHASNEDLYGNSEDLQLAYKAGVVDGFNKAMELNKDKVFTEEDIKKAIVWAHDKSTEGVYLSRLPVDEFIQYLQQPTEIEVEIEMETKKQLVNGYRNQPDNVIGFVAEYENILVPKLDSEGCLILKKI